MKQVKVGDTTMFLASINLIVSVLLIPLALVFNTSSAVAIVLTVLMALNIIIYSLIAIFKHHGV